MHQKFNFVKLVDHLISEKVDLWSPYEYVDEETKIEYRYKYYGNGKVFSLNMFHNGRYLEGRDVPRPKSDDEVINWLVHGDVNAEYKYVEKKQSGKLSK